MKNAKKLAS